MAKGIYVGVAGVARKVKKIYVGVAGVARKCKKIYVGVAGVARLVYSAGLSIISGVPSLSIARGGITAGRIGNYGIFLGGVAGTIKRVGEAYSATFVKTVLSNPQYFAYNGEVASIGTRLIAIDGYSTPYADTYDTSLVRGSAMGLDSDVWYDSSTSISNYALFGGGWRNPNAIGDVYAYDSSMTKNYTYLSCSRRATAAATVNNCALFIGGFGDGDWSSARGEVDYFDTNLARHTLANATTRGGAKGISFGEYALFGGGTNASGTQLDLVEVYDNNLVKTVAAPLSSTMGTINGNAAGTEYACFVGGPSYNNVVDIYDKSLVHSTMNFTQARNGGAVASIGNNILIGGGMINGTTYTDSVESFGY